MLKKFFIVLLLVVLINSIARGQVDQGPPNILWIVSEDNSPLVGAYGDLNATTPNIDQLAREGVLYDNAFSNNPACAVARSTLITGVYATSMGTHNHRSKHPIPEDIRFFPEYLKQIGYYTTNNYKTDYNTSAENKKNMSLTWDESGRRAHYKNRKKNQPFFAVFNIVITHASSSFGEHEKLGHDKDEIRMPPYLPEINEMKYEQAHFYDLMEKMDSQVGEILLELEESGQLSNTIVFYYSDHGGFLPRSKGYLYESGLRIPLIISFPKKYQHLSPGPPGSKQERMVSFVDFAPSILNMLGIAIPKYMEGNPFLGKDQPVPNKYIYSYKDRMDERYDVVRGVRSEKYFYRMNYRPHKIYGQYLQYAWNSPSVRAWANSFHKGELNETQSKFWKMRPFEELYFIDDDPDNINNLADNPDYAKVLEEMRNAQLQWLVKYKDGGLIPEPLIEELSKKTTVYEYMRNNNSSMEEKLNKIHQMCLGDRALIRVCLASEDPLLEYWGIIASMSFGEEIKGLDSVLLNLTKDTYVPSVRLAASEAIYRMGHSDKAIHILIDIMKKGSTFDALYAMDLMEMMGKDALPALPLIKGLLLLDPNKTSVYEFRAAALRLIEKINNNSSIYWEK